MRKQFAEIAIYEGEDCGSGNRDTHFIGLYIEDGQPWVSDEDFELMAHNDYANLIGRLLVAAPVAYALGGGGRKRPESSRGGAPQHYRPVEEDVERAPEIADELVAYNGHYKSARFERSGYVYLLHSNGTFKIGHAKEVDKRVAQISPKMPYPVDLVLSIATDDRLELESRLHKKFSDKRLNGEWFALTEADIEYMRGLA